jgi:hypothetical protein
MSKEYISGTFCIDIKCPKHKALKGLEGKAYIEKKQAHCKDCYAWLFFTWTKNKNFRIVQTLPEMSNKQLAAYIKGIDPVRVEDLTEYEILCL